MKLPVLRLGFPSPFLTWYSLAVLYRNTNNKYLAGLGIYTDIVTETRGGGRSIPIQGDILLSLIGVKATYLCENHDNFTNDGERRCHR